MKTKMETLKEMTMEQLEKRAEKNGQQLKARTLGDIVLEVFSFEVDNHIQVEGEGYAITEDFGAKASAFQPSPTPGVKKVVKKEAKPKAPKKVAPTQEIPEGGIGCACCGGAVTLRTYKYEANGVTIDVCKKCSADHTWATGKIAKGDESQIKPKHEKVIKALAGYTKGTAVKLAH